MIPSAVIASSVPALGPTLVNESTKRNARLMFVRGK
jgi:hypothetical protein